MVSFILIFNFFYLGETLWFLFENIKQLKSVSDGLKLTVDFDDYFTPCRQPKVTPNAKDTVEDELSEWD